MIPNKVSTKVCFHPKLDKANLLLTFPAPSYILTCGCGKNLYCATCGWNVFIGMCDCDTPPPQVSLHNASGVPLHYNVAKTKG
jgi:hypothetical protein